MNNTITDKLLLAALSLEDRGKKPFTAEDLVVAAWSLFPDSFGLGGYVDEHKRPRFPDSNRVFAEIMGSKPIRQRGYLVKVGSKMYELTPAGRDRARGNEPQRGAHSASSRRLPRDMMESLASLVSSRAFQKFRNGRGDDISFHDVSAFLGISPRSAAIELSGRLGVVDALLKRANEAMDERGLQLEHGGNRITREDIKLLRDLRLEVESRFDRELAVIRERTDQRR
jgi:hypothetical protein